MRSLFFLCSLILFSSMTVFASAKKLVIIGDSLTEGYGVSKETAYGSLLQEKIKAFGKNWNVVISGISGSTSASAPSRMKWILKNKPDLIIFALGSNDALRGVKVTETKKNIQQALELGRIAKVPMVLAGLQAPPNYGAQYTKEFAALFPELARRYQARLIPFLLDKVAGISALNQADGIHPNEKGHEVIAQNIFIVIKDML